MKYCLLGALSALAILSGCSGRGVKFNDLSTNAVVPQSLQNRTLWTDVAFPQYKMSVLVGHVLQRATPTSPWERRDAQLLPNDFSMEPELIEDGAFYHSVVSSAIAMNGNATIPIMQVAAKLSDDRRLELTIEDSAMLVVESKQIPRKAIEAFLRKNPRKPGTNRVWVQGVMITKLNYKQAKETSASATVSGGAFGADGRVFAKNETMLRDVYITMLLINLDDIEDNLGGPNATHSVMGPMDVFDYRAEVLSKDGIVGIPPKK